MGVEVTLEESRVKGPKDRTWRRCLQVTLNLSEEEDGHKTSRTSAEDLVKILELMRSCWQELARGLVHYVQLNN